MENKILIIGNFGYSTGSINGQTIKTRNILALLNEKLNSKVEYFDTNLFESKKTSLLLFIGSILKANKIVYMPAHSNLKLLFPLIYLICKIRQVDIIYVVIGGWLPEFIKSKFIHKWALKRIKMIGCETTQMKAKLEEWYHFKNTSVLPNFRLHKYVAKINNNEDTLRIVFMSRVIIEKGLDIIFRFVEYNSKLIKPMAVEIDFYGPLHPESETYFNENLNKYANLKYKGILPPENVHETLNKYDLLILPTRYVGEGFPGAILDAYIAGIPVIVSNWKDIASFVEQEKTGFVFELSEEENFSTQITKLYNNRGLLLQMKKNAFEKSSEYSAENCWRILKPYLN